MDAKRNGNLHCNCHTGTKAGKKAHKLNFRSFIAFFLSAVLLLTSSDCLQIYAEGQNQVGYIDDVGGVETANENEETLNGSAEDGKVLEGLGETNENGNNTADSENQDKSVGNPENPDGGEGGSETAGEGGENPEKPDGDGDGSETAGEGEENPDSADEGEDGSETSGEGGENPEKPDGEKDGSETAGEGEENPDSADEGEDGSETSGEDEENPKNPDEEIIDKGKTPDEPQFVRTSEGAVIISAFEPLPEEDSHIILDKKGTLAQATSLMPSVLKGYAYAYIEKTETGETETRLKVTETEKSETEKSETEKSETEKLETEEVKAGETETGKTETPKSETEKPTTEETKTEADSSQKTVTTELKLQELEVPVNWECSEDYENTELESYIFRPVWDSSVYFYEENEETFEGDKEVTVKDNETDGEGKEAAGKDRETAEEGKEASGIPAIVVSFSEETAAVKGIVSTEEELAAALAAGEPKIMLAADIAITSTLAVPASAHTVLDGGGFSLSRGANENGAFIGTMLYLGGEDYTEEVYGTLTLTDICVDGKTAGNQAGSSAIIDYGSLILDEGAVIKNNYNYGTYKSAKAVVNDYGGGIQVYNELVVTQKSSVTGNFADEFGGGVYLADGAMLYLYADVVKGNSVSAGSGHGADLYASNGSTIYYDSSIDMGREGFYICAGAVLVPMQEAAEYSEDTPDDRNVEVYINMERNSGYTDEQMAELTSKLESKGYKVLSNRKTYIDTTDLRNWYVYDHYDTHEKCWGKGMDNGVPILWNEVYGGNPRRPYYGYYDTYADRASTDNIPSNGEPVYTIAEWLERTGDYYSSLYKSILLTHFKEHIYTRNEAGTPKMTFVGYGNPAFVDFLFYDPESDGEKVVDFDINSSQVNPHTLAGNGFLVNVGISSDDNLHGYLVYYCYKNPESSANANIPNSLEIYRINGISVADLHRGLYDLKLDLRKEVAFGEPIAMCVIDSDTWESEMSIQVKATPKKIEVRQQPKAAKEDIGRTAPILTCSLGEEGGLYSGFGPVVAYTSVGHTCPKASSFTYSNLRMYYTTPELEKKDMLNPLENADFTQEGTQKYFLNLFGSSDLEYNDSANFGQYQEYLKMMQKEGIALITDRVTPFGEYLGQDGEGNLYEIGEGVAQVLSVDELVEKIMSYAGGKTTTDLTAKLQQEEGGEGLKNASPKQSVGNIWLKSAESNKQVRKLYADSFADGGYTVQIMDDIAYYHGNSSDISITYDILKPGIDGYSTLATKTLANGGADGDEPSASASFVIPKNSADWPKGSYTVRQRISNSSIYGYTYFDLYSDYAEAGVASYKVEHYKQNLDGSGYTKEEGDTQEAEGIIGETVTAAPKAYSGFTENRAHTESRFAGTVTGDGSLVLKLFYDRNIYNVGFDLNGGSGVTLPTQAIRYGNRLESVSEPVRRGYSFKGWYKSKAAADGGIDGGTGSGTDSAANISSDNRPWNFDETVENNITEQTVTLYARWVDDIAPVLGAASYNVGYKDLAGWIIRKKDLIITVPITEEGSGVDRAEYTLFPENGDPITEETQFAAANVLKQMRRAASIQLKEENGQVAAVITISEDYKGAVSLKCSDNARNNAAPRTLTAADGGIIVEDNAPVISFSSKKEDDGKTVVSVSVSDDADAEGNSRITGGIAKITYHIDDKAEQELDGKDGKTGKGFDDSIVPSYAFNVEISGVGEHSLSVTALDNAGNENTKTTKVSIEGKKKKTTAAKKDGKSAGISYSEGKTAEFIPLVQTAKSPEPIDNEPDTGDSSVKAEVYATAAMIAGLFYILLYFSTGKNGMTEDEKNEFVSKLLSWAKRGGRIRRLVAIATIFWVLVYYHSIGKRAGAEWKEAYEK